MSEKERTLRPLRKVTSQADWLDNCIPRRHHLFKAAVSEDDKPDIYQFLVTDHWKPTKAETTENATDLFHVNFIVKPATRIVASIQREPRLQAGFARMRNGTKTDLRVYTESSSDTTWVTIEDKRLEVFEEHRDELLSISTKTFPWPTSVTPPPGSAARIWIQIWGQMEEYQVNYAKIFSATGVLYVWQHPWSDELFFSKIYDTLNGEVERTACLILEALAEATRRANQPQSLAKTVINWLPRRVLSWMIDLKLRASLLWKYFWGFNGIYILFDRHPVFFQVVNGTSSHISARVYTTMVGCGASGTVWRSSDGSEVTKRARMLSVPAYRGVVSSRKGTGVMMSYRGTPIRNIKQATNEQKKQLVQTLRSLHELGIHHHDVRGENVLIDDHGALTLIDFHQAHRSVLLLIERQLNEQEARMSFHPFGDRIAVLPRGSDTGVDDSTIGSRITLSASLIGGWASSRFREIEYAR
ncbi:hypothetical protein DFH08DRAFT_823955 [Mycena albidolilacea]|uniref:Non-specific serine/threonine protein kinase n=1 Tax=Mycena albidolilacea TaxID=1033008 RepID=A0AAD6Z4V9_9AGAR|nr:hypothetical protein DFH08DRAFT_823955 [Mycena albidolilacea]